MRRAVLKAGLLAALLVPGAPGLAAVTVSFVAPENYSDAATRGRYHAPASSEMLRQLSAHLVKLGERHLPAERSLRIDVLDIDLAGEFESLPSRVHGVRVMRDVTWPRIKLRYVLEQDGQVLREAEEVVADPAYLMGGPRLGNTDRLYYEKRMLDSWFRQRFADSRATP